LIDGEKKIQVIIAHALSTGVGLQTDKSFGVVMNKQLSLDLFDAHSGALSARLIDPEGNFIHLHSLVKPECEYQYFTELEIWGETVILLGTGLGYHLSKLNFDAVKTIVLIDFYNECVNFCEKRYFEQYKGQIVPVSHSTGNMHLLVDQVLNTGNTIQVIRHPASYYAQKEFYDTFLEVEKKKQNDTNKKSKILILYANFFLQEEIKNAVESCGLKAICFPYRKDMPLLEFEMSLQKTVEQEQPDIVLSVNMLGFDGSGVLTDLLRRKGIPLAVWFVDDPRPVLLHQRQFVSGNMIAFSWEKAYIPFLKSNGFTEVYYLPLATDPGMFSQVPSRLITTKIGFVGSSMGQEFLKTIEHRFIWHKELLPIVIECANAVCLHTDISPLLTFKEKCNNADVRFPYEDLRNETWLQSYIIHYASMLKRKQIMTALKNTGVEIYGDRSGWAELIGPDFLIHEDIDYRKELAGIYRSIGINVNITSCQMKTAVNQRVFDIPACGSFVINDYQEDLFELFDKEETVVYTSTDELIDKCTYYTIHSAERDAISRRARQRILKCHTYVERVRKIVTVVGG
jgi:spore maturation protein CgeB